MVDVDFVYFDAGGTLFAPYPSVGGVYARAGRPHGLDVAPERLDEAFREAWGPHTQEHGKSPMTFGRDDEQTREWWRVLVFRVFDRLSFSGPREATFGAFYDAFAHPDAWIVFSDTLPALERLRVAGIPCGVLSNWDYRLPALLESLALRSFFEVTIVSALEGVAKPDGEIFRRATKAAGVAPERVAYVGDHIDLDLEPGREAGFRSFLIDRDGKHGDDDAVPSLGEMLNRLSL